MARRPNSTGRVPNQSWSVDARPWMSERAAQSLDFGVDFLALLSLLGSDLGLSALCPFL